MATTAQKLTVMLAFVAAGLSFAAFAVRYSNTGEIGITPLAGGLLMLALGVGGIMRLRGGA